MFPLSAYVFLESCGTVAQLVERSLCDREVAGSIPGLVIPKTLKMALAAFSLVELGIRTGQLSLSVSIM